MFNRIKNLGKYAQRGVIPWWIERGLEHPMKNIEIAEKVSNTLKGKKPEWMNDEKKLLDRNKKISQSKIGKPRPEWVMKKVSETKKRLYKEGRLIPTWKGKQFNEEMIKNMSIAQKNRFKNKENHPWYGKHLSDEIKRKIAEKNKIISKEHWKDQIFRDKTLKAQIKSRTIKPNKKEQFLDSIIQSNFPNQFVYNMSPNITIINGRIPDWINCNGQKKIILFNGLYWHLWRQQKQNSSLTKEQVEEIEKKPYKELGFKVLHIWEDELLNKEEVINKINYFLNDKEAKK
jgi:very-short-patch-repair endonuclease